MNEKKSRRRRRGHGEGTVVRRGDGRYEARVSLGWRDGKRHRVSIYGATEAEVIEKKNRALRDHALGLPVAVEHQRLSDYLARWLEQAVKNSVRPLTYKQYRQHVRLYLTPQLGHIALGKLRPDHVQVFLNRQFKTGLSARTVLLSLVILKRALKQAERWNLIQRNPAMLVDAPRVPKYKASPLDPEQSRKLLAAAAGTRHEALYATMLLAGLRPGEAYALRVENADFEKQTLTIEATMTRVDGDDDAPSSLVRQEPKTDQSHRTIPMPEALARVLREHRRRQAALRLEAGPEWKEQGLLFTTRLGTPLEASNVHRDFKRLLRKAGLPPVRLHDLRHSCASLLLALGVPLKTIQAILGHSSLKTTADIYAHLAPQMQRDAADRLDQLFSSV